MTILEFNSSAFCNQINQLNVFILPKSYDNYKEDNPSPSERNYFQSASSHTKLISTVLSNLKVKVKECTIIDYSGKTLNGEAAAKIFNRKEDCVLISIEDVDLSNVDRDKLL